MAGMPAKAGTPVRKGRLAASRIANKVRTLAISGTHETVGTSATVMTPATAETPGKVGTQVTVRAMPGTQQF